MRIEMVRLYDIYKPLFNERQNEILNLYYNEDESLAEISENVGITRQGVRDCIVKAEAQLKFYEEALRLYKKQTELSEAIKILEEKIGELGESVFVEIENIKKLI